MARTALLQLGFLVPALAFLGRAQFEPPGPRERIAAIGSLEGLPDELRRALDPRGFAPIPAPGPSDWLASHAKTPQTFDDFVRSRPKRPDGNRKRIYLLPLGEFAAERSPPLSSLKAFASAYFALEVEVLPAVGLEGQRLTTRRNPTTGNRQVLTADVLDLLKAKLPADGFCLLGLTMEDLYPEPAWNFVFGQALLKGRVGVYSFARYDPRFYGQERGPDQEELLLRRSLRVLAHEVGHMFGLTHCVFFSCVLNGSNHLEESDSRPMDLCPVCLRKLQHSIGFDVADRYRRLERLYRAAGLEEDARRVGERLRAVLQSS
jgi:archaemetzincin